MATDVPRGTLVKPERGAQLVTPWGDVIYRVPEPPAPHLRHPALMDATPQQYNEQMLYACIVHSRRFRAQKPAGITADVTSVNAFLRWWADNPDAYRGTRRKSGPKIVGAEKLKS